MRRGSRPEVRSLDPGEGLTEEFVSIDGGRRIRIVRAGTGDGPLIVFEAGMGSAASQWNHIQRDLASRWRTLAYDRAGVGGSDAARSRPSLERIVGDLTQVLDVLGETDPVVLVGHSWGGPIARVFASLHRHRTAGLVLVDPTPSAVMTGAMPALNVASFGINAILFGLGRTQGLRRGLLPGGPSPEISSDDMELMWRDLTAPRSARAGRREAAEVGSSLPLLRHLEVEGGPDIPAIVLQGGRRHGSWEARMRDRQNAAAEAFVQAMPDARLRVIAGAGHVMTHEQPEAVIDAITEVVERVTGHSDGGSGPGGVRA